VGGGVLYGILGDLVARRGDQVDVQNVCEFHKIDQGVGDLVADRRQLLRRRLAAFLGILMWNQKRDYGHYLMAGSGLWMRKSTSGVNIFTLV